MRELECFLFKYFRKRRQEKSELSKTRSEPSVVSGKHNLWSPLEIQRQTVIH